MVDEKNQSDIVSEAFDALRATPPEQGPSLQALERTLQAMHQAQERAGVITLAERIRRMNKFIKYPIAAALALALILATGYALLGGHASVAFADVKAQIEQAKTLQMTVISEFPDGSLPTQPAMREAMEKMRRIRMTIADGVLRMEYPDAHAVAIMDMNQKKVLSMDSEHKIAMVMDISGGNLPTGGFQGQVNWLEEIRKCMQGSQQPLGEKVIDGKRTEGFACAKDGQNMEVWADQTGHPVLIKTKFNAPGLTAMTVVMSDIVINPELPDSFFSLAPPEGYTVQNLGKHPVSVPTEKDFAQGLRMLASANDGVFPALSPEESGRLARKIGEKLGQEYVAEHGEELRKLKASQPASASTQEAIKRMQPMMGELMTRMQPVMGAVTFPVVHAKDDFHYAGKGVKLGDADTAVAWWQDKDKGMYRVLYGDLSFKDAPADKLPATAPAQPE